MKFRREWFLNEYIHNRCTNVHETLEHDRHTSSRMPSDHAKMLNILEETNLQCHEPLGNSDRRSRPWVRRHMVDRNVCPWPRCSHHQASEWGHLGSKFFSHRFCLDREYSKDRVGHKETAYPAKGSAGALQVRQTYLSIHRYCII